MQKVTAEIDDARRDAGGTPPWLTDLLLAAFVALAIALIIATDLNGRHPDVVAYLFAVGFGALVRRRMPRLVLVATMLGLFAYYTMGYPPIGVAIPVVAALYSAAEVGRLWPSITTGFVVLSVSTFFRIRDGESLAYLLAYELISNVALMAAAIALGDSVRSRATVRREQEQIHRLTAEQLTREAEHRLQRQRDGIARELHDLVGHTMSVISLQANVAAEAIARGDTPAAEHAVDLVRSTGEQTMRELRGTVRVLRADPAGAQDSRTVVSLANVDGLAASARAAGLEVVTEMDAPVEQLSPAIDAAAYRITQEALTNAIRHSHATRVRVHLRLDGPTLRLEIADNGRGAEAVARGGHGIAGMTERARLLGGSLDVRSDPGDGFAVVAALPARLTP